MLPSGHTHDAAPFMTVKVICGVSGVRKKHKTSGPPTSVMVSVSSSHHAYGPAGEEKRVQDTPVSCQTRADHAIDWAGTGANENFEKSANRK